jgi:hypothetical protein
MTAPRPLLHQPASARDSAPRIAAARGASALQHTRPPKSWHRDQRRGLIAVVIVTFLFVALLCAYGVHTQMAQTAARAAERDLQVALATGASLNTGTVLFVPEYGSTCRRRWIDNATWTFHDGGEVECEEQAAWHATMPSREYKVEKRIDAIRNVFQARTGGKVE